MHFDQLLAQAKQLAHYKNKTMQFPANWCQGRTAFGGLSAALLYQAMCEHVKAGRRILSISTNFVGPLLAETDFTIEVELLREGKSATQVLAKAIQGDQVCVIAQACFGVDRESAISVPVKKAHSLKPVNPNRVLPYQKGVMPEFFQHIDLSPQLGGMPFTAADTSHLGGWMRFKDAPAQFNEAHIIALTDAWPPTLLQMFQQPAPASSMSWYLEFVEQTAIDSCDWIGFDAVTHHSRGGYGIEDGCIWSESGKLLALTRQTVAIFA